MKKVKMYEFPKGGFNIMLGYTEGKVPRCKDNVDTFSIPNPNTNRKY